MYDMDHNYCDYNGFNQKLSKMTNIETFKNKCSNEHRARKHYILVLHGLIVVA